MRTPTTVVLFLVISALAFASVDIATESYPSLPAHQSGCKYQIAAVDDHRETVIVCADKWKQDSSHTVKGKAATKFQQSQADLKLGHAFDRVFDALEGKTQTGDFATPYTKKASFFSEYSSPIALVIAFAVLVLALVIYNHRKSRTFRDDYELLDGTLLGTVGNRDSADGWQYAIRFPDGHIKTVKPGHQVVDFLDCDASGRHPVYWAMLDQGEPWLCMTQTATPIYSATPVIDATAVPQQR